MLSVEDTISKILNKFSHTERIKIKWILISVFLTGFFSYFYFMIYGYTCPDGICEGLYFYTNADWALGNGRWATRYLNELIGHNVVIPFIVVILYCACVALSVYVISLLLDINHTSYLVLTGAIMTASPVIIAQLPYAYMALAYGVSLVGTAGFCYLVPKKGFFYPLCGTLCLTISLGLYQSYIGAAALLIILIIICDLLHNVELKSEFIKVCRYLIAGVIACILDMAEYKVELYFRGVEEAARTSKFDIRLILSSMKESVMSSYVLFANYFKDDMLKRKYFYLILFMCLCVMILSVVVFLYFKKKYLVILTLMIFLTLMPIGANMIHILVPYSPVRTLMCYHYVLVIPFLFSLLEWSNIKPLKNTIEWIACLSLFYLVSSYVISANATFICWKISYRVIEKQTDLILRDIYDLPDYKMNETRIVFVGYPEDSVIRSNLELYRYAIGLTNNVAYWSGWTGTSTCRQNYLLNYYGIEAGHFSSDEYAAIIKSEEYIDMPIWPSEGSVRMINDMAVVRLE